MERVREAELGGQIIVTIRHEEINTMGEIVASFIVTIFIYILSFIAYRRGW
jgi:hypothetical protein